MDEKKGAQAPQHPDKAERDNRADQLNQNNEKYWKARGMTPPQPKRGR